MAVIKVTNSKATLNKAISYITKEEKTEERLVSGKDCNPSTVLDEMQATKEQFNKLGGRQYCHYVQSFAKTDNITHQKAHEIGIEWAEKNFKGHEVLIATHQDKDHVHNHFIVNSVSFEDGRKFHSNKKDLDHLKVMSDKICEREGFSVIKEKSKEITSFNQKKYKAIERAFEGNYKSYIVDTALAVNKVLKTSTSREFFIKGMESQGYSVNWTDTNKNVTFTNENGKKIRLNNLKKTFKEEKYSKEGFESEFTRLREKELAKHRAPSRTKGDRGDIGIKVLFGNITGRNEISSRRDDKLIGTNKKSIEPVPIGQKGTQSKTSSGPKRGQGYKEEYSANIQRIQTGNRGTENPQLSKSRTDDQEIERGNKSESRLQQQNDKGHTGISTSSKENTEPHMEGKSETICNPVGNNSRNDSLSNRSVSTSNPLDEVVKALESSIKKALNKEKVLAEQEKRKLEKKIEIPKKRRKKNHDFKL